MENRMEDNILMDMSFLVNNLRKNFNNGLTRSLEFRQQQLAGLQEFLKQCKDELEAALYQDLKRPHMEALAPDIAYVAREVAFARKKLSSWMKPERVSTPLFALPGSSKIYPEPYGVVLIISPWNYPVQLPLVPLIGALAAGNCIVIKPSELAPATSKVIATQLPKFISPKCLDIVEGDAKETTALLAEQFDYIFYTGNGTVGRIVLNAAARYLTPVTLELGGKSPCIVDKDVNLSMTARRIVWGKFYNAGQTCIAPDYILAHEAIEAELLSEMKKCIRNFYGDTPQKSPDFARIINTRHFQRLQKLIPGNGELFLGGDMDEKEKYIAPTILRHVPEDAPIMSEEIFGPILPVLKIKNMDEAISFINARPKPLALYLFTKDSHVRNRVLKETSSGGVAINHVMLQEIISGLPFGGVGASGMGAYHGKYTFKTFSHYKSVLSKPLFIDPSFIYPPYNSNKARLIRWLLQWKK